MGFWVLEPQGGLVMRTLGQLGVVGLPLRGDLLLNIFLTVCTVAASPQACHLPTRRGD